MNKEQALEMWSALDALPRTAVAKYGRLGKSDPPSYYVIVFAESLTGKQVAEVIAEVESRDLGVRVATIDDEPALVIQAL